MPMTPCARPGCDGAISDGYCDTCGLAPEPGNDLPWIEPYRIIDVLDRGPAHTTYLADAAGRQVTLQVFEGTLAAGYTPERFERDVAKLRAIDSPYTAAVIDADSSGPWPYIATAHVPGPTLEETVHRSGALYGPRLSVLARRMAQAIADTAEAGVVHGAIQPANVVMAGEGPVLVGHGHGISRAFGSPLAGTIFTPATSPAFMPPEASLGGGVEPSADVYAWAATVTYAITGRPRFSYGVYGSNPLPSQVPPPGDPGLEGVPAPLSDLLRSALAEDPSARPSAREVADAVGRLDEWVFGADAPQAQMWQANAGGFPQGGAMAAPPSQPMVTPPVHSAPGSAMPVRAAVVAVAAALVVLSVLVGAAFLSGVITPWLPALAVAIVVLAAVTWWQAVRSGWARAVKLARARRHLARGRYRQAEALLRGLAEGSGRRRVLAQAALASALRGQGRLVEAEQTYGNALFLSQWADVEPAMSSRLEANLAVVRHELGATGARADLRRADLAVAQRDEGRLEEAERTAREALEQSLSLKAHAPEIPVLRANLAAILRSLDRPADAEELLAEAEQAARRSLGGRHPETLTIRASLAAVRHDLGRHAEAAALLESVIADRARTLGRAHPATLRARASLGFVRLAEGEHAAADREFATVLADGQAAGPANVADVLEQARHGRSLLPERLPEGGRNA